MNWKRVLKIVFLGLSLLCAFSGVMNMTHHGWRLDTVGAMFSLCLLIFAALFSVLEYHMETLEEKDRMKSSLEELTDILEG